jgi:hypothetical protein
MAEALREPRRLTRDELAIYVGLNLVGMRSVSTTTHWPETEGARQSTLYGVLERVVFVESDDPPAPYFSLRVLEEGGITVESSGSDVWPIPEQADLTVTADGTSTISWTEELPGMRVKIAGQPEQQSPNIPVAHMLVAYTAAF